MAVQTKTSDTRLKTKKTDKSKQGEPAKTGEMSDDRKIPSSRTSDRGIGSSYAMAVANILEDAKTMKSDAKKSFLGQESKVIDPKQFSQSLKS